MCVCDFNYDCPDHSDDENNCSPVCIPGYTCDIECNQPHCSCDMFNFQCFSGETTIHANAV